MNYGTKRGHQQLLAKRPILTRKDAEKMLADARKEAARNAQMKRAEELA